MTKEYDAALYALVIETAHKLHAISPPDAQRVLAKFAEKLIAVAHPESEKATAIPMDDCGLTINCGRDGTWLHFSSSTGIHASINVENMPEARSGIIANALRQWCADRQTQAAKIRGDAP